MISCKGAERFETSLRLGGLASGDVTQGHDGAEQVNGSSGDQLIPSEPTTRLYKLGSVYGIKSRFPQTSSKARFSNLTFPSLPSLGATTSDS